MKYSILTVASKSYFPFLDVFINSIFANCDIDKINKIYIVGVDLNEYKNYLYKSDKIVYLDDELKDEYDGVHSTGWYKTTKLKTQYLKHLLDKMPMDESIIMIDSDTVILEDMYSLINKDYDIQITKMSNGEHISASGVLILHIACFMIFNNIEKSKLFVEKWLEYNKKLLVLNRPKPHETPSMNQVINDKKFIKDYNIESLDENIVCADRAIYPNTKIIHFKSGGEFGKDSPLKNFIDRFQKIKCFDNTKKDLNYIMYLQKEPFRVWSDEDFNVTKESFYSINKKYSIR